MKLVTRLQAVGIDPAQVMAEAQVLGPGTAILRVVLCAGTKLEEQLNRRGWNFLGHAHRQPA